MSMLIYDPGGVFKDGGISQEQLAELAPRLEAARQEVDQDDLALLAQGASLPAEREPLDAAFYPLPEELLQEQQRAGSESVVGRIEHLAGELRERVETVVLLGIGGSAAGARALMDASCHPYHNQRGGKPRFFFAGNSVDTDATRGLIDLLSSDPSPFAVLAISKSGATLETAIALRQFVALQQKLRTPDWPLATELVVPITAAGSRLDLIADQQGWSSRFRVPQQVGGRFSLLSPVGLLPAALLGIDLGALLQGAAAMNRRFRESPPGDNPVLDYAGVGYLAETTAGRTIRLLATWNESLYSTGLWYDQLLAESLGKEQRGATPLTTLNTRDLHSRAQQHQQGRRDKLITNLEVTRPGAEPLAVGPAPWDHDQLDGIEQRDLGDLERAAREGMDQALGEDGCPTARIELPGMDPFSLGEFYQMMMLATVVEGKLLGVNPYGQPGVEVYKQNMKRLLGLDKDENPAR
ncbi:MAG: glucose-6-phosphate isomerase [Pirellulaceae bacterium]